jgi:hypothetical protein
MSGMISGHTDMKMCIGYYGAIPPVCVAFQWSKKGRKRNCQIGKKKLERHDCIEQRREQENAKIRSGEEGTEFWAKKVNG